MSQVVPERKISHRLTYPPRNGLKYHKAYGTCVKKAAPDARSSDRPYYCYEDACGKAYKNMNGLRWGWQLNFHAAKHVTGVH